jgi:aspartyl-tRNA(Asn)/glutamyl-tRNA(Gln) amidotransferase subunit B
MASPTAPAAGWRERYEPTIGLEIHVQLSTRTKMFCGCELSFGDDPNVHTCPVCLGHPGTLPVTNARAIDYAIRIALALGCEVAERSSFHRKNYFYPDLPKGYQISQYDLPLARGGRLGDVRIHRAHLEEDAAKLTHVSASGRIHGSGSSVVDFNRGGTPLVEIVTEPDLDDPAAAREWLQLLRTTIRQLGVSDVNMEEGSLRCDANVSLRPKGGADLGVKAELKNMNSFRYLERGVEAELARQAALLDSGETVEQETLHFDPRDGSLTPLRSKEYAHDYRYLPEPDLVDIAPTAEMVEAARAALPELPADRRQRYEETLELPEKVAAQIANDMALAAFYEEVLEQRQMIEPNETPASPARLAGWTTGELSGLLRAMDMKSDHLDGCPLTAKALVELADLVEGRKITHGAGREVLRKLVAEGGDPAQIVEAEGLGAMSEADADELGAIVERAIEADPGAAARVREGNMKAIGPLVGFVMKETRGRADGDEVTRLLREKLG